MDFKYIHIMGRQSLKSSVLAFTGICFYLFQYCFFFYFAPSNNFENSSLFRGLHLKQIKMDRQNLKYGVIAVPGIVLLFLFVCLFVYCFLFCSFPFNSVCEAESLQIPLSQATEEF